MQDFFTCSLSGKDMVEYHSIPFSLGTYEIANAFHTEVNQKCSALFFLGMTCKNPEGSEWWGQGERYGDFFHRTFLGDRIAQILIVYENNTADVIPVIFGVNAWNYELFEQVKLEENLKTYGGPYREPFQLDRYAAELLRNSLCLMNNKTATKKDKYILGIKTDERKTIKNISVQDTFYKNAGVVVSAVTALLPGSEIRSEWILRDCGFYICQEYQKNLDLLMRRLYQFKDDIPKRLPADRPARYDLPIVDFIGGACADLFTNVLAHNLFDICHKKINDNGIPTTSTYGMPNYGHYVGFGTFDIGSVYGGQIWARDTGRILTEAARGGADKRIRLCCDLLLDNLYDKGLYYEHPNWKRVINSSKVIPKDELDYFSGKENDGHAALMLGIYNAYLTGAIDIGWIKEKKDALADAADWFFWQIRNPEISGFQDVLYSETEAALQRHACKDLFSNIYAFFALEGFSVIFSKAGEMNLAKDCSRTAKILRKGILERFTACHPRYGRIFTDTLDDCWTYEYKRFAPLFLQSDFFGYDPLVYDMELLDICRNTFLAQKEDYYSPASGRQMGYGQGYLTQSALLLDRVEEYSECIEYAAMFSYHHTDYKYIIPEGVIIHPSKRYWFRNCDLGNAVQQGEIVKCARLIIGIDDILPQKGISLIPRLPKDWQGYHVEKWSVSVPYGENFKQIFVDCDYSRTEKGYRLCLKAAEKIRVRTLRFGPFDIKSKEIFLSSPYQYDVHTFEENNYVYVLMDKEIMSIDLTVNISE